MTNCVEVRTGARLHFGLLDTQSTGGRLGGIGMMIDRPGVTLRVTCSPDDRDTITGPVEAVERTQEILRRLRQGPAGNLDERHFEITIHQVIPPHHGLGSGTQLTLAVATALQQLSMFKPIIPIESLGRSRRSAVGGSGFFRGGFIFDPASDRQNVRIADTDLHSANVIRKPVPETWRIVVIDPASTGGPSGETEASLFDRLPPFDSQLRTKLIDLVQRRILPSLDDDEFQVFSSSVAEFNREVGTRFAAAQGSVYAHPLIREIAQRLADTPWPHLAQSSWGPAAAVFCEDQQSAEDLVRFLKGMLLHEEADVFIAPPRNRGADVFNEPAE